MLTNSFISLAFATLSLVLGIETSCDDTGAAVVDSKANILGESLNSQTSTHVELGGIIPPIARDLHRKNIDKVVKEAMEKASVTLEELSAIAVTNRPGLPLSLLVGLSYAKNLSKESGKPLIPIHHMEAHALTVRLTERVEFPFLVFLVSGGHCLLALVEGVSKFLLLGHSLDESPGDAFDKVARRLKLKNRAEFGSMSGGASIECAARQGDPTAFPFPAVRTGYRDCNFSFSGIKFHAQKLIEKEEARQGVEADGILPNVADFCASFQYGILQTLARRLQRALLFCELKGYLQESKTVVLSGGVASNHFVRAGLSRVCAMYDASLVCPPPRLCTDNGVMIAWNGVEKLKSSKCLVATNDLDSVDIIPRCPLGENITDEILKSSIKSSRLKLLDF
ncbi:hypothetical protein ScPMuIL_015520 [Solemya velum]